MSDFLFHKVDEKEKEEIKNQAADIIDSFSKKLESVENLPEESVVEREEFYREEECKEVSEEEKEKPGNKEFKKKLLENAPKKNKDFILSEKKKW